MTLQKHSIIGYTGGMSSRQTPRGMRMLYGLMAIVLFVQNSPLTLAITLDAENNIGYETIDEIDGSTDMGLRFGGSVNKTFKYVRTTGMFTIDDDVRVTGNIVSTGVLSGAMLSIGGVTPNAGVLKTTSGAILNADMDSNDTLLVFGNTLGAHTLKFINTVQEFEFSKGIRVNGQVSGSGNLAIEANATIDDTTFFVDSANNRVGIGTKAPETSLEVIGTMSGAGLNVSGPFASKIRSDLAVGTSLNIARAKLAISGSVLVSPGSIGTQAMEHNIALEVIGTASGSDLHATKSLRSSGSLSVAGTIENGLIGWWNLDEGAGTTAADNSNVGNDGTVSGSPARTTGKFGKTINFDGTDDLVQFGDIYDLELTGQRTVSAWIYPTAASIGADGYEYIVSKQNTDAPFEGWGFALHRLGADGAGNPFRLRFSYVDTDTESSAYTGLVVNPNAWYHVVATYNNEVIRIYVNGVLQANAAETTAADASINSTDNFSIGADDNATDETFTGAIDAVKMYSRALTEREVVEVFTEGSHAVGGTMTGNLLVDYGRVGLGTLTPETKLEVVGTASGTDLYATQSLRSSGSLVVRPGGQPIPTLYVDRNNRVGIRTPTPGSTLSVSGSIIVNPNGTLGATAVDTGLALEITGTMSGRTVKAMDTLASSGFLVSTLTGSLKSGLIVNSDLGATDAIIKFGNATATAIMTYANSTQRFNFTKEIHTDGNVSASGALAVDGNVTVEAATKIGLFVDVGVAAAGVGTKVLNAQTFEVIGTVTGSNLFATNAMTGSHLAASVTFGGAGLSNCTGAGNKLTWLSATKQFACEADQTGGASGIEDHYVRASGDTMTGGLLIESRASGTPPATIDAGLLLEVAGSASGLNFFANKSISGSHLYAAQTFFGAGLTNCSANGTDKLLWSSTTKQFSCGTDQGGSGGLDFATASTYFVNDTGDTMTGGLLIENRPSGTAPGTIDPTTLLEVGGTASGADIFGQQSLRSSGTIVLKAAGTLRPTFAANGTTQQVGIANTPHSTLTASGSFATTHTLIRGTGSITDKHQVIFASGSVPITLTLPTAVGINGRQYTIKKIDTSLNNFVTIATTASQTIDRLSSWILFNRGQEITVVSDGANWLVADETTYGYNGFRAKGTTLNQWYTSPLAATALGNASLTATASARAMPFIAEKVMTIDAMAVSVVTSASNNARLGIYRDNGNTYPGKLIVDAGAVTFPASGAASICASGCTTTGNNALPVTIQPGLYWLVVHHGALSSTIRGFAVAGVIPIMGYSSALGTAPNLIWTSTTAQAALPSTFYPGATAGTAAPLPAVFVRTLY